MKIVFFTGTEAADYVIDLLLAGLTAILGSDNVAYGPVKEHLGEVRPLQYPERTCWFPNRPRAYPYDYLLKTIDDYDLVIVGYPSSLETAGILQEAAASATERTVVVSGVDKPVWRIVESLHPQGKKFIRELLHETVPRDDSKIMGCAIPYNAVDLPPPTPWAKKDISLLWVGAPHHGRAEYIDVIREFSGAIVITEGITHEQYVRLLSRTRVAPILHGAGKQTYRHLEAAAAGCCVIEQAPTLWSPAYPSAATFTSSKDLRDKLHAWVGNLDARFHGDALRAALVCDHTHTARAAQLLSQV